jgi:hypothetical protein
MKTMHVLAPAVATLASALVVATGVVAQEFPSSNVGDFLPSVTAMNQKLKNDGVDITYAFLPKDGRLAILSSDPEARSGATVIGSVALSAGDHREVKVSLSSAPKAGTSLWAQVEQAKSGKPFAKSDERAEQRFKVL